MITLTVHCQPKIVMDTGQIMVLVLVITFEFFRNTLPVIVKTDGDVPADIHVKVVGNFHHMTCMKTFVQYSVVLRWAWHADV